MRSFNDGWDLAEAIAWFITIASIVALVTVGLLNAQWSNLF
jgi:hypothetical protein